MNLIQSIISWFNIAKPNPTNADVVKQIAFHCEEFAEMLDAVHCDYMAEQVRGLQAELMSVADDNEKADNFMATVDKVGLLDACGDQVVTSTGVAVLVGMDFEPALAEINRSNYTKFNADGTPYIKPNGKIGKNPETYQEPELEPFLDRKANEQKSREKLLEILAQSDNPPAPYTSDKIRVERCETTIEVYEIYPEQLDNFIACDSSRLTADYGSPTDGHYSDRRRVLE